MRGPRGPRGPGGRGPITRAAGAGTTGARRPLAGGAGGTGRAGGRSSAGRSPESPGRRSSHRRCSWPAFLWLREPLVISVRTSVRLSVRCSFTSPPRAPYKNKTKNHKPPHQAALGGKASYLGIQKQVILLRGSVRVSPQDVFILCGAALNQRPVLPSHSPVLWGFCFPAPTALECDQGPEWRL